MRITILGGNRFVGLRVASELVAAGHAVTVVHRSPPSVPGCLTIRGDREDPAILDAALASEPDAILDMSLYNLGAARAVVAALDGRPLRYVAVSTAAIYAQDAPTPWVEWSSIGPAPGWGDYGVGKAESDAALLAAELPNALLVRPPYVIGQGDPDGRCALVFDRLRAGLPVALPGDGSALIETIDVEDMAPILIDLLAGEATGVLNVGGPEILSVRDFMELCGSIAERHLQLLPSESRQLEYAPELWPFPNLTLSVRDDRFRRFCQIRPRPLAETLAVAWARSAPTWQER
jgi:2'-hydroxyisoflavone reductase